MDINVVDRGAAWRKEVSDEWRFEIVGGKVLIFFDGGGVEAENSLRRRSAAFAHIRTLLRRRKLTSRT